MAERLRTLSSEAKRVLGNFTLAEGVLRLAPERLDRKLYEEVAHALSRLGGKWVGRDTQGFVFDGNEDVRGSVREMLETGVMPPKNPYDFYSTPLATARKIAGMASVSGGKPYRVLEPSAGRGMLADALLEVNPNLQLTLVEVDTVRAGGLRRDFSPAGHAVFCDDFLSPKWEGGEYDRVVINPPFRAPGKPLAYIDHVRRAFAELRSRGVLVAVVPSGFTFRTDRACTAFREFVAQHGVWEPLESGAFLASGTGVNVAVLRMVKP
jgi:hypothetical protein